jgi:hypothetical protein
MGKKPFDPSQYHYMTGSPDFLHDPTRRWSVREPQPIYVFKATNYLAQSAQAQRAMEVWINTDFSKIEARVMAWDINKRPVTFQEAHQRRLARSMRAMLMERVGEHLRRKFSRLPEGPERDRARAMYMAYSYGAGLTVLSRVASVEELI